MKKKFLTFALILMVCCSAIFIMAGCGNNGPTYTLSCSVGSEDAPIPFTLIADADMTNRNERNYIIIAGLTSANAEFNLIENARDEKHQVAINDVINGGSVSGFSVKAPGKFKMTVTYQGCSCFIYYTVAYA